MSELPNIPSQGTLPETILSSDNSGEGLVLTLTPHTSELVKTHGAHKSVNSIRTSPLVSPKGFSMKSLSHFDIQDLDRVDTVEDLDIIVEDFQDLENSDAEDFQHQRTTMEQSYVSGLRPLTNDELRSVQKVQSSVYSYANPIKLNSKVQEILFHRSQGKFALALDLAKKTFETARLSLSDLYDEEYSYSWRYLAKIRQAINLWERKLKEDEQNPKTKRKIGFKKLITPRVAPVGGDQKDRHEIVFQFYESPGSPSPQEVIPEDLPDVPDTLPKSSSTVSSDSLKSSLLSPDTSASAYLRDLPMAEFDSDTIIPFIPTISLSYSPLKLSFERNSSCQFSPLAFEDTPQKDSPKVCAQGERKPKLNWGKILHSTEI